MLRQLQLRWSGHLVRMDDDRPPKGLFYGHVAPSSRRQRGQVWGYKDTLKTSPKRLQINPANWEGLAQNRHTWRRKVNTSVAIFEANRITAVKAKRETQISTAAASQRQRLTASNVSMMATDIIRAD
nr:unnamed protein product [Spirometra erinaceieuropaei]